MYNKSANISKSFKAKEDKMNGYIIKATYLTGPHKGRSYFLQKGVFVTDDPGDQWSDNCYKTENICKSICRKLENSSMVEHVIEKRMREYQSKNGYSVSEYMINELMKYKPYFVKTVRNSNVY